MVPILWEDDWPCVASESGLVENEFLLPSLPTETLSDIEWSHETSCDHFNEKLPLHWLTLRMPMNEQDAAFSLTSQTSQIGALRLFTRAATLRGREHPAFAGRRLRHKNWAFSAALEFTPKAENETAGIVLFQSEDWHYRFEIFFHNSGLCGLRLIRAAGKEDELVISAALPEKPLVLAVLCEEMALSFFYGKDQYSLKHLFSPADARILSTEYAGGFVGTLAGVFASGNGKNTDNYADVLWAEYKELIS
jgi:alpha-N-arabinofuranosidase